MRASRAVSIPRLAGAGLATGVYRPGALGSHRIRWEQCCLFVYTLLPQRAVSALAAARLDSAAYFLRQPCVAAGFGCRWLRRTSHCVAAGEAYGTRVHAHCYRRSAAARAGLRMYDLSLSDQASSMRHREIILRGTLRGKMALVSAGVELVPAGVSQCLACSGRVWPVRVTG